MQANVRRYVMEFGGAMVLYAIFVLVSQALIEPRMGEVARAVLAAAPVLPALAALWALMRYYRGIDELQQRIIGEAVVFAFLGGGFLTFTYGFLETAGLPSLSMVFVFPLMIALWGIGMVVATRRYA